MLIKFLTLTFFLFTHLVGLSLPKTALAASYSLSGTVQDGSGNAIGNATVHIYTPNTTTDVVPPSTTDPQTGNYTFSNVPQGTYDVQVTPPSGSNFTSAIALSQNINNNTVINFILTPNGGPITFSGYIYDQNGKGLSGQHVTAGSTTVTTDSSGFYKMQVAPGAYMLTISGNYQTTSYNLTYLASNTSPYFNLGQSTTLNITLPLKQITVQVQDSSNNPVPNINVSAGENNNTYLPISGGNLVGRTNAGNTLSNTNGQSVLWLFPGGYHIDAVPPSSSNFSTTTIGYTVTTDATVPLTLISPITFSGYIYDQNGKGLAGQTVEVDPGGAHHTTAVTDSSGLYKMQITPGTYMMNVYGSYQNTNYYFSYLASNTSPYFNLGQTTTLNITLPFKGITIQVQDSSNTPVGNVNVSAGENNNTYLPISGGNLVGRSNAANTLSGSNGQSVLWLFPGGYHIDAVPPTNSNFTTTTIGYTVSSDATVPLTLISTAITFSGYIYDQYGHGIPGQLVTLDPSGIHRQSATTDSNGFYKIQIAPGAYQISVSGVYQNTSYELGYVDSNSSTYFNLGQTTALNIILPFKQVTIQIQDSANNPLNGVTVSAGELSSTYIPITGGNLVGKSNAGNTQTINNGNATLLLFPGTYHVDAVPPSNSIYADFTLGVTITGNQTEIVSLQLPYIHTAPVTTLNLATRYSDDTYTDPTTVTLSATAAAGFTVANTYYTVDGGKKQTYTAPFSVSGSGSHTITYWSIDTSGVPETPNTKTFSIDDAPAISPILGATINEGGTYTATGSFTDNDSTSWTGTVDYGDGSGTQQLTINPDKTFTLSHQYLDNKPNNAPYTVTVTITDNQGAGSQASTSVVVNNVAPTPGPITVQSNPVVLGNPFYINSVQFTDPGVLDTHQATWYWGDGQTSQGTVIESNGSGYVSATDHVYSSPGSYEIKLIVTDNDGAQGTSVYDFAAIYQPTRSGLFSGHSIFNSPQGADLQNKNATGMVHFAIDVKYANGSNVPTGTVNMNFSNGNISLNATSFDWLTVNGTQAMLEGSGTVNGAPGYTFLASGLDGTQTGTGYIRFQIKDPTGNIIYDTQPNVPGNATPTTPVTGGMVIVHN